MKDDDEIIFDRDTSKPKEKLKKKKRRKDKEKTESKINDINPNKNNNSVSINNIIKGEVNNNKKVENNFNTISNVDINNNNDAINKEEEKKSENDKLVNIKLNNQDSSALNSNLNKDENKQSNMDFNSQNEENNLNENNNNNIQSQEEITKNNNSLDIKSNHRYNDDDYNNDTNQNRSSKTQENENIFSKSNNTKSKFFNTQLKDNLNTNSNIKLGKDKLEKEYQEALNSGDKEKIIIILQRKVEYLEYNINDLNLLIKHLRNDIHKKEKIMHLLTETNNELKRSLNNFSKQLDKKIFEINNNNNKKYKNSKSLTKIHIKKYNQGEEIKDSNTELNKALIRIRFLEKENENLKIVMDASNKVEKMKELENINKSLRENNNRLEEEINLIKRDIIEHSYCEKKRDSLLEKIKYLTEENNQLKKYIKKLNIENEDKKQNGQNNLNTTRNKENNKLNIKLKKTQTQLPKILNKNKNGENIKKDNEIENLADKDEIYILIKLFQGDETKFIEFKKKLIIYAKLKENIINKYKAEEKSHNKKVYSMEEQIEYLNHKVKESEMRINIFQQQLNDKEFKNKKLKKQLIEEKKEKEDSKQKLENK